MKRVFACFFLLIMCLLYATGIADNVSFLGGDGSSGNPYRIATVAQLNAVREHLNSHFILCSNIDLASTGNWVPIGSESSPFTGTFDGNGYRISNITVKKSISTNDLQAGNVDIGFFGYTSGATITKLGIEDASYQISAGNFSAEVYSQVGGIAGTIKNTTVTQCYFRGSIENTGGSYVLARSGGIAAIGLYSTVSDCYVNGSISGNTTAMNVMVAGLIPWLDKTNVERCYAAGKVTGNTEKGYCYAGGIHASGNADVWMGYVFEHCGTVKNCAVVLEELTAVGASVTKNDIGAYSKQSNNIVMAYNSADAKQQGIYSNLGWDFVQIWKSDNDYPDLLTFMQNINGFCAERDGWSLINYYNTFEYDKDYDIPVERWNEVYGIIMGQVFHGFTWAVGRLEEVFYGSSGNWQGSCNGLSLLAATGFTNQIELKPRFSNNGDCLYDYGYEKISEFDRHSIKGVRLNSNVCKMIERAQICQLSIEFITSEVFKNDRYYEEVINHLERSDSPLLVNANGHSMVIDTYKKSTALKDGWSAYYLYDCNAPIGDPGIQNAHPCYQYEQSLLYLNTSTGDWVYYYNGKEKRRGSRDKIRFYDVTKLDKSLLRCLTDGFASKYFRLFTDEVFSIFVSGSNAQISENNTPVVEILDGEVRFTSREIQIEKWTQEREYGSSNKYYTYLPNADYEFELKDSMINFFKPNVFGTVGAEGKCLANYDDKNDVLSIKAESPCCTSFALQYGTSDGEFEAIRVDASLDHSSISLRKMDDGSMGLDSSDKDAIVNIYLDNNKDSVLSVYKDVPIKDIISIRSDLESIVFRTPLPVIQYPESEQVINVEIDYTADMSVVADHAVSYQWFVDRNDGKGFVEIHGAEKADYTTTAVKKENNGYRYFCRVANADGFVDSPIFTLSVIEWSNLPKTGDTSMPVGAWAAVLLASIGALAIWKKQ